MAPHGASGGRARGTGHGLKDVQREVPSGLLWQVRAQTVGEMSLDEPTQDLRDMDFKFHRVIDSELLQDPGW